MDQGATCTEVGLSLGDDGPLSWKNPKIAISVWLIATECGTVPHIYHFDLFTSSHFGVLKIQEGGGRHFKKSDQIGSSFWRPNGGRYVHVLFKSNRKSGTASLFMRFLPYFYFRFVSGLFSSVLRVAYYVAYWEPRRRHRELCRWPELLLINGRQDEVNTISLVVCPSVHSVQYQFYCQK